MEKPLITINPMEMGINYLIQACGYLSPEISIAYGLDVAMMIAVLHCNYCMSEANNEIIKIKETNFVHFPIEQSLKCIKIWKKSDALDLIDCLIENKLITALWDKDKEIMLYYFN